MLDIRQLTGGWSGTTIVEDVSFSVSAGELVAVIGRNGVGKSTLLELIVGRASRKAGVIRIGDADISALPVHKRARTGLGYVPQEREVFASLTVDENLSVAQRDGPWTTAKVLELFPSLATRRKNFARQLSGGEQQMLSIARALVGNPKVLLLDEPTEGLAPIVVTALAKAIQQITADGNLAIVLVEQNVNVALDLSSRSYVMDRGRIVAEESSAALEGDMQRLGRLMGLEADDPVLA